MGIHSVAACRASSSVVFEIVKFETLAIEPLGRHAQWQFAARNEKAPVKSLHRGSFDAHVFDWPRWPQPRA